MYSNRYICILYLDKIWRNYDLPYLDSFLYFNENKIKQLTHLRDNLLICCIVETIYYQFSTEQHTVMT